MHFDESTLFEYSVGNAFLPQEAILHFAECAYCRERYEYYKSFNMEVNARLGEVLSGEELAEKLAVVPNRKLLPEKDFQIVKASYLSVEMIFTARSKLQRFFYNYPRFTAFSFAFLALLSLMFLLIR